MVSWSHWSGRSLLQLVPPTSRLNKVRDITTHIWYIWFTPYRPPTLTLWLQTDRDTIPRLGNSSIWAAISSGQSSSFMCGGIFRRQIFQGDGADSCEGGQRRWQRRRQRRSRFHPPFRSPLAFGPLATRTCVCARESGRAAVARAREQGRGSDNNPRCVRVVFSYSVYFFFLSPDLEGQRESVCTSPECVDKKCRCRRRCLCLSLGRRRRHSLCLSGSRPSSNRRPSTVERPRKSVHVKPPRGQQHTRS